MIILRVLLGFGLITGAILIFYYLMRKIATINIIKKWPLFGMAIDMIEGNYPWTSKTNEYRINGYCWLFTSCMLYLVAGFSIGVMCLGVSYIIWK